MVAGLIAGLGSSAISALSASATNKKSYKYSKRLQQHQYELQRQLNQNAYQDTTYSMRQAGINPMLAIGNGASAGSVSGSQFQAQNPELEQGISTALQAKQMRKEQEVMDSQKDLNKQNARKVIYEADLAHENSAIANEQLRILQQTGTAKAMAEIDSILAGINNQNRLTDAQIRNLSFDNILKTNSAKSHLSLSKLQEVEASLTGKKLGWYDIENYAKALGYTTGAFIAAYGLKRLPSGKFIKPAENLIKVAPKIIQASKLGI